MLKRLSNLTFRSQLLLVFGTVLSVVLLAALLSLGRLGDVDAAGRKIDDHTRPYSAALWAAAVDLKAMANDERGFLMTGDKSFREEIKSRAETIRGEFERAGQMSAHAEDRETVTAIADKVDRWIESAVLYIVEAYRHEIADVIATTVAKWDPQEASERIEAQVGRDLQFIRINGTLVGGLAGLAIHTVSTLLL